MKIDRTDFEGLYILEPVVYRDDRGYFLETWREQGPTVPEPGIRFVQDNYSWSEKGVVRGLHYQTGEASQKKLVGVCHGVILDVAVDLRVNSPTFGRHFSTILDDRSHRMVLIPEGFAHGFSVLSDTAAISYKCSAYYRREMERGVLWNDPELNIDWQVDNPVVSEKDLSQPLFGELSDRDLFREDRR